MESKNDMYVPLWFLSAFKVVTCGLTDTIIMQFDLSVSKRMSSIET